MYRGTDVRIIGMVAAVRNMHRAYHAYVADAEALAALRAVLTKYDVVFGKFCPEELADLQALIARYDRLAAAACRKVRDR